MRILLSDGRYAYDSGNRGLLIASKPRARAVGTAIVFGVAAAILTAVLLSIFGSRRQR